MSWLDSRVNISVFLSREKRRTEKASSLEELFPWRNWTYRAVSENPPNYVIFNLVRLLASHQGEPGLIPVRVTPDFRMWESFRTMALVGGFSRGSTFPTATSFRCTNREWRWEMKLFEEEAIMKEREREEEGEGTIHVRPYALISWDCAHKTVSLLPLFQLRLSHCDLMLVTSGGIFPYVLHCYWRPGLVVPEDTPIGLGTPLPRGRFSRLQPQSQLLSSKSCNQLRGGGGVPGPSSNLETGRFEVDEEARQDLGRRRPLLVAARVPENLDREARDERSCCIQGDAAAADEIAKNFEMFRKC
ncbi:hypothetical protein PR048_030252 [Dryococelus australis]|uniref:Uncharacterized protein n=1 Tax=Dryococelus australis TaxID=614101 RepID=A0ABQ9G8Y1_9NEOP|nr:hypothetical protein PR048_030252 [Dryococelus australis]